jgi:transcriptional regulator with XRE-family HTH domain
MILDIRAAFAIALRELRTAKSMSQEDFSEACSQVYMSQLETGKKNPTLGMIEALANEMGIHPLTLLLKSYTSLDGECSPEELMNKALQELKGLANPRSES